MPHWEKPPELTVWPDSCSSSTIMGQRPPPWVEKGWKWVVSIEWEGLVRERGS